jgi:hypothetical protein
MQGICEEHNCAPGLCSRVEDDERWHIANGGIGEEGAY